MKAVFYTILISYVVLATASPADQKEFRDDLLYRRHDSFEHFSLAQIWLALPNDFFEGTYQTRIADLISGAVEFRPTKKEMSYQGDGGQMSLTVRVIIQTKDKLVIHVTGRSEETTFWSLERIPNGWKVQKEETR